MTSLMCMKRGHVWVGRARAARALDTAEDTVAQLSEPLSVSALDNGTVTPWHAFI